MKTNVTQTQVDVQRKTISFSKFSKLKKQWNLNFAFLQYTKMIVTQKQVSVQRGWLFSNDTDIKNKKKTLKISLHFSAYEN
jgi:hypothetical protein